MREIIVKQICSRGADNEDIVILDEQGRVWLGYQAKRGEKGMEYWVWVWNKVTLPEVQP